MADQTGTGVPGPHERRDRAGAEGVPLARVVVLAGPSGCGKTYLAERSGLPVIALDDFYRDGDSPDMPVRDGRIDWEDPRSWDTDGAVDALARLCRTGTAEIPVYELGSDARVGSRTVTLDGHRAVVAEGLFAAEIVDRLAGEGVLADAVTVRSRAPVTFVRRLVRDLRERRKPPGVLLRMGWEKLRSERAVVAHQVRHGCRPASKREVSALLARSGHTGDRLRTDVDDVAA